MSLSSLLPRAVLPVLLLLVPAAGSAAPAAEGPRCAEGGLALPGDDGERVVTLPGPCLAVSTDGDRSAVAAGAAGAFVVDHPAGSPPRIRVVATTGRVEGTLLRGDLLALTEALTAVRWVDLRSLEEEAIPEEPDREAESDDAVAAVVGEVVRVRGPRVFVEGLGLADAPGPGGLVRVRNEGRPRQLDPETGRLLDRGIAGYTSVLRVVAKDPTQLVAELGRGDRARVGDAVDRAEGLEPTEELMTPTSSRPALTASVQLTPAVSLEGPGVLGLGRVTVGFIFPIPLRIEAALRQGFVAVPTDGLPGHSGYALEGLATLDLDPFEVGLAVGYQRFRGPTTGLVLGHYIRAGFRDGLCFEVHTRFLLGTDNPFGGVEGRGQIPLGRSAWLSLEGGGGSSIGFGLVGTRIQLRGQGGRGSWSINPAVGFAGTWYGKSVPWAEYCEARPDDWDCDPENEEVQQGPVELWNTMVGPAISVTVEARL